MFFNMDEPAYGYLNGLLPLCQSRSLTFLFFPVSYVRCHENTETLSTVASWPVLPPARYHDVVNVVFLGVGSQLWFNVGPPLVPFCRGPPTS